MPLKGKLVVSIAAGVTTRSVERALGRGVRVIRVMPNLPAMVGAGVSALCRGKRATLQDLAFVRSLFQTVGTTIVVPEKQMDAVTAVSGSGPAYVFLFVECLMTAARQLGFSEAEARTLVYATLSGSARMLVESPDSAGELRRRVTSKGGTTQAATDVFMKKNIAGMFNAALKAARDRAKELSR